MPRKQQKRKRKEARQRAQGPVNNHVGRRLREIRLAKGMTCKQVARRIGISPGSYSGLENGWYRISLDNLFGILKALGAGVGEVWPPSNGRPPAGPAGKGPLGRPGARSGGLGVQDVLEAVAEAFEVPLEGLASPSRWSRLQEARGACGILVRQMPGLSFRSLARRLRLSDSALGNLVRRHSRQAGEDRHLAARIGSARRALEQQGGPAC